MRKHISVVCLRHFAAQKTITTAGASTYNCPNLDNCKSLRCLWLRVLDKWFLECTIMKSAYSLCFKTSLVARFSTLDQAVWYADMEFDSYYIVCSTTGEVVVNKCLQRGD